MFVVVVVVWFVGMEGYCVASYIGESARLISQYGERPLWPKAGL